MVGPDSGPPGPDWGNPRAEWGQNLDYRVCNEPLSRVQLHGGRTTSGGSLVSSEKGAAAGDDGEAVAPPEEGGESIAPAVNMVDLALVEDGGTTM